MKVLIGFIVGIAAVIGGGYLLATSGRISVAATERGGVNDKIDDFLARVSDKSIAFHAPRKKNPLAAEPSAAAAGLLLYRDNCVWCHGAKDLDAAPFAKGMNPGPPMLDMEDTQKMTDGELFWVISHGLRATGMPSFSATRNENEIWKIAAFVRHLPKLSDAEVAALKRGEGAVAAK